MSALASGRHTEPGLPGTVPGLGRLRRAWVWLPLPGPEGERPRPPARQRASAGPDTSGSLTCVPGIDATDRVGGCSLGPPNERFRGRRHTALDLRRLVGHTQPREHSGGVDPKSQGRWIVAWREQVGGDFPPVHPLTPGSVKAPDSA